MNLIYKSGFKYFEFFLLSKSTIGKILKIVIFMNKINNVFKMVKYLCSIFPKHI